MRRFLFVFLIGIISSVMVDAHVVRTFSFEYNEKDFNVTETKGLIRLGTNKHTAILKNDPFAPALPYICVNVLIGLDETYLGFSSKESEILLREGVTLEQNPIETFKNEDEISVDNPQPISFEKSSYPDLQIEYTGTHTVDGYKFLTFLVCPFRYDYTNKKLFFENSIDLNIRLLSSKKLPVFNYSFTIHKQHKYDDFFINEEHKTILYGKKLLGQVTNRNNVTDDYPYKYLIITTDTLKDEFERLAQWKSIKGIKAKVLTVEDIYGGDTHVDRSNQLKIKYAIKEYYRPYGAGIQYVLLGGDDSLVPVEMCHIETTMNHEQKTDLTPADIYYSSFTTMEWDNDHNGQSAELGDSVELSLDVAIARLPVKTAIEARKMIGRIIDYEKNANVNNWSNNMLLCGVQAFGTVFEDGREVSDAEIQSDSMYDTYIRPFWDENVFRFYDTYTDNPLVENYDVIKENLQQELTKGYSFVFVNTHGSTTGWSMETGFPYDFSKVLELSNPHYSIITTAACLTNKFDSPSTCLGEAFMQNENGGILAYYGCSRESIGSSFAYILGIDMRYMGAFYNKLFGSQSNSLGDAILNSKRSFYSNCSNYNSTRWMYLTLNVFGDPEMPVYKNIPSSIPDATVSFNGSDMSFTSGVERPLICLKTRFDDGNTFYYYNYAHSSPFDNNNVFHQMFGEYTFCLTKKNYLPTHGYIGNTIHLQNESLSGKNNVIASQALIGSNVTSQIPTGSVVVENGKTIITSRNEVNITRDFEVKLGAELEIQISNQNQVNL